jgi:hypothetical protein
MYIDSLQGYVARQSVVCGCHIVGILQLRLSLWSFSEFVLGVDIACRQLCRLLTFCIKMNYDVQVVDGVLVVSLMGWMS